MASSLYLLIGFIGVIIVVEVLNGLLDHSLNAYGLVPRTTGGLIGIPLSPLLHGGFLHVQSNAVGLLALGCLAVIRSRERFPWVCLVIILFGGLALWLVGRSATHIGASGLVFGLFGYLLAKGFVDRSIHVGPGSGGGGWRLRLGDAVRDSAHQRLRILGRPPLRLGGRGAGGDNCARRQAVATEESASTAR